MHLQRQLFQIKPHSLTGTECQDFSPLFCSFYSIHYILPTGSQLHFVRALKIHLNEGLSNNIANVYFSLLFLRCFPEFSVEFCEINVSECSLSLCFLTQTMKMKITSRLSCFERAKTDTRLKG